jgi:spore germination protein KB
MVGEGIKPIFRGVLHFLGLPFLELVVFLMIFPYVMKNQKAGKNFLQGTLYGGMILIIINLMAISVLGADITSRQIFPTYILAKGINVGHFFQRVEAIIAGIWFLTIYIKITICFYSTALGLSQVLKLKDYRFLTLPLGMILLVLSLVASPNIIYFQTFLLKIWTPYSLTFGLFLPLLLLSVSMIKNKFKKANRNN